MSHDWYKTETIDDDVKMLAYAMQLPGVGRPEGWVFRGTSKVYPLQTSLERALNDAGVPANDVPEIEQQLLKEFKRRAHYYVDPLPADGDLMGWLALMQHYGAPTRLLDWTYSFYIAAFFALSDAVSTPAGSSLPCVVWALYRDAFSLRAQAPTAAAAYDKANNGSWEEDMLPADSDNLQKGINAFLGQVMKEPEKCIWAVNSFRLNERLSVQQGLFLCPGDVTISFEENLRAANPKDGTVIRFELSTEREARRKMLTILHRMNINSASLFPGLDGFARSLKQKPWVPGSLRPRTPSHL
jgi:hypothetical protein